LIRVENLTFYYNGAEKPALKNINLNIGDGEFVLVTGPSGGGKSSLCRCFNGLIPHFYGGKIAGRIEVQGLDVLTHETKELATRVGMIFQDPENQLVTTEVEREIAFGLENLAFPRTLIARRIEESLDTLGISHLRHRHVYELSGGEKQKIAIASVLALHPEILILDEPTSELDPRSAEDVLSLVQRLNDELGITIVLIEHRLDRVLHYVDRLIVLDGGKILADGKTRDVLDNHYAQITTAGIGVPPIIKLAHELRNAGVNINGLPLTVKEGREILARLLPKNPRPLPSRENTSSGKPVIEVRKLWYAYPGCPAALKNVDLSINEGDFIAVMGKNSSGKTTLVKHFNGLLKPVKGSVSVGGIDTRKTTTAELGRKVGFVFQNPDDHLFADTVEDEIGFTLKNAGLDGAKIKERINELLTEFGLDRHRKLYPRYLSGGEKQRVALASVLAARPKILVLDEPTRGMEYQLKVELMKFLKGYAGEGNTVILVTHDVETVAEYADKVVLMSEGEIIACGSRRDILAGALLFSPQINRLVQSFEKNGIPGNILTVRELLELLR